MINNPLHLLYKKAELWRGGKNLAFIILISVLREWMAMNQSKRIRPVILSGGSGTRLWPLSRDHYPKQFLSLCGEKSLLQQTIERVSDSKLFASPIIIAGDAHRFLVAEQLRELGVEAQIILEPEGRNTAPAVAIAALMANADETLLILPADHLVRDEAAFIEAVRLGADAGDRLITFGIKPDRPETGYGYIEAGDEIQAGVQALRCFTEKPDEQMAKTFISSGNYVWNSGMFMFPVATILTELEKHNPEIVVASKAAIDHASTDLDFLRLQPESFKQNPSISIDYAIMEKTDKAAVIPVNIGWSDIGSFASLWEESAKDEQDNACRGDVLTLNAKRNYVHSPNHTTGVIGVDDLIVSVTEDAVLVAHRDKVQQVKELVSELKSQNSNLIESHRKTYRPWGYYDSLYMGSRAQVKELHIKPGAKLSLQEHKQRAEHWVVISGIARITRDGVTEDVSINQSVYVPIGCKHRIENATDEELKIIEVQSGDYLGEDDIIRYDDDFGRIDDGLEDSVA